MRSSWLFPPRTREAQFDEKWSFVAKKQAHCDPAEAADEQKGDWWDHVGYDPEHRLVVCVVPGARNAENAEQVVAEFKRRTGGRPMRLITSDEHRPYTQAVPQAYGVAATATPSGLPIRAPRKVAPPSLCDAAVHKVRRLGRVARVVIRLVFGAVSLLAAALAGSAVNHVVNVSLLERQHLTDRHRNARKGRKTTRFSKDWEAHEAATYYFTPSTATTSAGRCGRCGCGPPMGWDRDALRRWQRA